MKIPTITAVLGLAALASAEVFFHETFSDGEGWKERWTPSAYREDLGKLEVAPGKWFADEKAAAGLRTTEDYRFYATSSKTKTFSNKDKNLVLQFDVKNEQDIDCGGSYLKFFDSKLDAKTFNGDSSYNIMFGPDICGPKAMVHAIFNYNGTNYDLKKSVSAPKDTFTHTYTLIVKPDQTYEILIDSDKKASGSLLEDWDFLPPKQIKDPQASKPADWVDEAEIDDPEDVKPEGYDAIPEFIPDPNAKKPEDWDDDMDGDWEAPSITNPDYKGPWTPKRIPNPLYKGEWEHPLIDNPEYKVDNEIYAYEFGHVGLDVWQVTSGTILDNILITDDIEEAEKIRNQSAALYESEKDAKKAYTDKIDAENKAKMEDAAKEDGSEILQEVDVEELLEKKAEEEAEKTEAAETPVAEDTEAAKKPVKDEL